MTFWLGLTCNHDGSVHRLTEFFWLKSYKKCWRKFLWHSGETCSSSMTGLQLILHFRSENISPPLTTIAGWDGVGLWLGLFKLPYLTATPSYEVTLMPWFTRHQLILKRTLLPVLLRWLHLAFLWAHVNLCWIVIGCVSRLMAMRLNVCSKLVRNITFFPESFHGFAWFPTLGRPTLIVRGTARMHVWHTVASQ